jgi:hypothetical protein
LQERWTKSLKGGEHESDLGPHGMRPAFPFPQVTTGDLNIAIVGQLPPTKFALSDAFEASATKTVGSEAAFRCGFLWK